MHAYQMTRFALFTTTCVVLNSSGSLAIGASVSSVSASDTRAIYKAVGLTERAGKLFDACDEIVRPELEVVDLNSDGRPEVFVTVPGSCHGGAAGAELSLLIKGSKGDWKANARTGSGLVLYLLLLGMSTGAHLLLVCHCERDAGNVIRIISARQATKRESTFYGGSKP